MLTGSKLCFTINRSTCLRCLLIQSWLEDFLIFYCVVMWSSDKVSLKNEVFCNVTLRGHGGLFPELGGTLVPSCWGMNSPSWVCMNCLTVNMVAVQSTETPVSVFQSTRRNIIEYLNLQHRIFFISWMSSRSWSVPITKFPFHSFIDWGRFKEQYITWCLFSDSYSRLSLCIRKIKLLTTFMSYILIPMAMCR